LISGLRGERGVNNAVSAADAQGGWTAHRRRTGV